MGWQLFKIRDSAIATGRAVFSVQQLANLTATSKPNARVYASRLVAKGMAQRIIRGKLSFTENLFAIASQLIEPSYVTALSALNFHTLVQQIPAMIHCATTRNSLKFQEIGIEYHKIKPALFNHYIRIPIGNTFAMVATPEKALADAIYLKLMPEEQLNDFQGQVNLKTVKLFMTRW